MSDTFCNAVGELYSRLKDTGARRLSVLASEPTDIALTVPEADKDGYAVGLLIDNVNHPDLTQGRIEIGAVWSLRRNSCRLIAIIG